MDFTQLPDRPEPMRTQWASYRQVLRDLSKKGLTPEQQLAAWPKRPDT